MGWWTDAKNWEVPFTDFKPLGGSVSRDKETGKTTSHDYDGGFLSNNEAEEANAAVDEAEADANNYGKDMVALYDKMYEQGRVDQQPFLDSATFATRGLKNKMTMGMYDPNEFQFNENQYQVPGEFSFDASKHEMPGEFSFSADQFRDDPFYQFLQDEGRQSYEASKAARGGLASTGTLFGLQERGQNIAGKYYGDEYNRQASTYDKNMNRALGERAFDYGTSKDIYGTNMERALNERQFGYGQSVDDYNRDVNTKADDYNRWSNMAGGGQLAQNAANSGMNYASQVGNVQGNLANMGLASAMNNRQMDAQSNQAFWNNIFNAGSLGLGAYSLFGQ